MRSNECLSILELILQSLGIAHMITGGGGGGGGRGVEGLKNNLNPF